MKISSYKYMKENKYKLKIDQNDYLLYEDIILKYNILLKKEITNKELETYLSENNVYDNYYKVLKFIKIRIRSKKEIIGYLEKNNVSKLDQKFIIKKLEDQGYINDTLFCRSYIRDAIYLKNYGPLKIINNLKKFDIDNSIIEEEIKIFTKEDQKDKIVKYIDKQVKLNKNKSLKSLKEKLLNNLLLMGYNREDINYYLDRININEQDIYQKEYDKLYTKLSKKYSGYELDIKVKQKLYQKGFSK